MSILIYSLFSCINNKNETTESSEIIKNNRLNLKINGGLDNLLQVDSIFKDIEAIPLETRNECLITSITKALFYKDKILLHDNAARLLVFNINGKFLYEIGKQGRGPGEFSELRDFDLDKDGNVYILDYLKIHKYKIDGAYIKSFSFHYSLELCYPLQFAVINDNDSYIWGGSFGIRDNSKGNIFAMYEMEGGKIIKRYFPVKYNIVGSSRQFTHFGDLILIDPIFGSNIIYSINNGKVAERYFIDFGKKTLDISVPEGFNSLGDFKARIDNNYFHTIYGFTETENWIYFKFVNKHHLYNVYYSKELKKSFLSMQWPLPSSRIAPWQILDSYKDCFIAFIDPKYVIGQIDNCKKMEINTLPEFEKKNISRLGQLKITDNPIFFMCSTKTFKQ
jgi:hypothetical protein